MDYIAELQSAIRRLHGCDSEHVETVPVVEAFLGKTLWQGDVEVFAIRGHPQAQRAYAWSHLDGENDKDRRFVTVLGLPPVESAETAVRAAIIAEIKNAREKQT